MVSVQIHVWSPFSTLRSRLQWVAGLGLVTARQSGVTRTDTLRDVFDFVDALDGDDAAAVGVRYSLVSNFPRRVFGRERDAATTLGDGGLAPQAMLMYRLDDDE